MGGFRLVFEWVCVGLGLICVGAAGLAAAVGLLSPATTGPSEAGDAGDGANQPTSQPANQPTDLFKTKKQKTSTKGTPPDPEP